jgi:hypothetical protein
MLRTHEEPLLNWFCVKGAEGVLGHVTDTAALSQNLAWMDLLQFLRHPARSPHSSEGMTEWPNPFVITILNHTGKNPMQEMRASSFY